MSVQVSIEDPEICRCIKCGKVVMLIVTDNGLVSQGECPCHDPTYEPIDFGGAILVWDEGIV